MAEVPPSPSEDLLQTIESAIYGIPRYASAHSGAGIVLAAGGVHHFTNVYVLIRVLRRIGCGLPIQLWHRGDGEFDTGMRELVRGYDVEPVAVSDIPTLAGAKIVDGRQLLPLAALHSRYEEVIVMHSDIVPVQDPKALLCSKEYREAGAIFWSGTGVIDRRMPAWSLLGLPPRSVMALDPGMWVAHKEAAWEALNLAAAIALNYEAFSHFRSGKHLAQMVWLKFGVPYATPKYAPQVLHRDGCSPNAGILCQQDFDGQQLFQHRTILKWQLNGVRPWIRGALLEPECRRYIDDLRKHWAFHPGGATSAPERDRGCEYREVLCSGRWALEGWGRYGDERDGTGRSLRTDLPEETFSHDRDISGLFEGWPRADGRYLREVRFVPDGSFGDWSDIGQAYWDVKEVDKQIRLSIFGRKGQADLWANLTLSGHDAWEGWKKVPGTGRVVPITLKKVPQCGPAGPRDSECAVRVSPGSTINAYHTSKRLSDHLAAIYACAGAADAGFKVEFHTPFAEWCSRIHHPNLKITSEPPSADASNRVDLNALALQRLRHSQSGPAWMAGIFGADFKLSRPRCVYREVAVPPLDFKEYIVVVPYSGISAFEWPLSHWRRLVGLLKQRGYEVVGVGAGHHSELFLEAFGPAGGFWVLDQSPLWIVDLILGAAAVIATDNPGAQLGGLLEVPTVALHAQAPPAVRWPCTDVIGIYPETSCSLCRWDVERGYNLTCEFGCSALATIGPETVLRAVLESAACRTKLESNPCQSTAMRP